MLLCLCWGTAHELPDSDTPFPPHLETLTAQVSKVVHFIPLRNEKDAASVRSHSQAARELGNDLLTSQVCLYSWALCCISVNLT